MSGYLPTIGLEIHAELKTQTKMFCRSKNDADETRANVNICPVCMAHPGTLPVINHDAVMHVLRVGCALGGKLADYTEFDRKNYFYPDLPKGYQLSQYEYPLVSGGELLGFAITRVHLEEDSASSMHDDKSGATSIDYNRAGVPLMELVTEPVLHSAEDAGRFARELQLLLRYLGASEANMEKGEMRVEANISVSKNGKMDLSRSSGEVGRTGARRAPVLGTKVEIKNLNSFRSVERAIAFEIKRQTELLERDESVVQETRGWDENKQQTFPQRVKEGNADYRYFPDPDLPSLKLSEVSGFSAKDLSSTLPELPWKRRERYLEVGVKPDDADSFVRDAALGDFFDEVSAGYDKESILLAANYIANDLVKVTRDAEERDTKRRAEIPISARNFKEIVDMLRERKLNSRTAKDVLALSVESGDSPHRIAAERGFVGGAMDDAAISAAVDEIIAENSDVVADFRSGKGPALEFLVGQCMKALRGAADPMALRELLKSKLGV
ncbi:MAG: Asp-tRNA(Asn)/Glu-tRNA(Gln) amidotransferase subunit GatB [bacterium]|nr:Asp-tRNA(Asn)/Glu-tRNA(Gln) amidotransferase subunit GatB [bacterium]